MTEGRAATPEEGLSELEAMTPGLAFRVALPNFEGPLDLLLHLIREHKVDIFDIPIALITEKYVSHLDAMKEINLDIAGEFLVMAATLTFIKSRLLLPRQEVQGTELEAEDAGDPRAELVRRLLDYQKYKDAADTLARQDILDRDVFARKNAPAGRASSQSDEQAGFAEISVYKLIEALDRVIRALEPKYQHQVVREHLSITEAMQRVIERLKLEPRVSFFSLFEGQRLRHQVIITFLAILEMCKLKLIRLYQEQHGDDIFVSSQGDAIVNLTPPEVDENEYK